MSVTIDIKLFLVILLLIALIVLVVYAVLMIRKLLVTLDRANKVLSDVEVISEIAANRSQDIDGIIGNASDVVYDISDAVAGNANVVSAVSSAAKAAASIKGAFSGKDSDPDGDEDTRSRRRTKTDKKADKEEKKAAADSERKQRRR